MTEEFIHFLWKFRMLGPDLANTDGDPVVVVHPGDHNTDSGPDFFNARVRIGETMWAGNVEMHVSASDWNRHRHGTDPAYANTILHVVYHSDAVIPGPGGRPIPTLEIRNRYPEDLFGRYESLMNNRSWIPCGNLLAGNTGRDFGFWAPSLAMERLSEKSGQIGEFFRQSGGDWEETAYRWLAHCFGFRINAFPFELLARSLPFRVLTRYRNSPFQTESLLFGQAGLLSEDTGPGYPARLRMEYAFLKAKHRLEAIPEGVWKFLRLRPSNFPTIRISQFSGLISGRESPFTFISGFPAPEEVFRWFDVTASEYWNEHYTFSRWSPPCEKRIGRSSVLLLAINAVAPFLFFRGEQTGQESFRERALQVLEEIPAEDHADIRAWRALGIEADDALRTQALVRLKGSYCDHKRCLQCRIGRNLLNYNAVVP